MPPGEYVEIKISAKDGNAFYRPGPSRASGKPDKDVLSLTIVRDVLIALNRSNRRGPTLAAHKLTKKDLKQDSFVDWAEKSLEFLQANATG